MLHGIVRVEVLAGDRLSPNQLVGMQVRSIFQIGLSALVVMSLFGSAAGRAQAPPANPAQPLGLHAKVFAAADALGMVRGIVPRQSAASVIVTSYEGTGMLENRKISFREEYVYAPYLAARIANQPETGQAAVMVVRDGHAWNESSPGVNPVSVKTGAERRMADIFLTPHGAVRAAVTATASTVTVTETAGATVISLPVSVGTLRIELDASNRPAHVEVKLAKSKHVYAATYSDYKDFNHYGVFAPATIVRTADGRRVADLTVTSFGENPYVIVPTPEQLRQAAVKVE